MTKSIVITEEDAKNALQSYIRDAVEIPDAKVTSFDFAAPDSGNLALKIEIETPQ